MKYIITESQLQVLSKLITKDNISKSSVKKPTTVFKSNKKETPNIGQPKGIDEKKGKWIQKVDKQIKKKGTEGVCSGKKFGSESCPPGSKRYNLAKTFRKMAKDK